MENYKIAFENRVTDGTYFSAHSRIYVITWFEIINIMNR